MPEYDLSGLSSRWFQQLVQSVATCVLGPGVVSYGVGPDGGRDATFEGKVPFPSTADSWDGYGVIQAKYRERLVSTTDDGNWAVNQLTEELKTYTKPDCTRRTPEYFVFATNVALTSVPSVGSRDRCLDVLETYQHELGLKGYALWGYDQLCTYIDTYESVRTANTAFVTTSDVLNAVISALGQQTTDLYDTLINYTQRELINDEGVNLRQAGHHEDGRIPLASVFVDLPAHQDPVRTREPDVAISRKRDVASSLEDSRGFINTILEASSERLDPATVHAATLSERADDSTFVESRGRFVLIGGPGQGKTTLTQFICQLFRAAIIRRRPPETMLPDVKRVLSLIDQCCATEKITCRITPRFPFKIILNDFAKELSSESDSPVTSVLEYLSSRITRRAPSTVTPADILRFLGRYPSVLIFDGLDEVPSSSNRADVLDAIRDFWIEVTTTNADILAIATSRPQGYNEDFSPAYYQHQQLLPLSDALGQHFAKRLVDVRYISTPDRKEEILRGLERALRDPSTQRLMRSPLQIAIMTGLVERIGQPPETMWDLFAEYYRVIYERELGRNIPASHILRKYRQDINAIHHEVGLLLQIESERTGATDARLSYDRFRSLVVARLRVEGHSSNAQSVLVSQIVNAVSNRLVFLVEVESHRIGFEIRSLQEFMAAECLMDAREEIICQRLTEIALRPFWRTVFLFAAGQCFSRRQALRDVVLTVCGDVNEPNGDDVAATFLSGSDLAIAILEDGCARGQPRYLRLLLRLALRGLDTGKTRRHIQLADVYDARLERTYRKALVNRLNGANRVRLISAWNCLLRLIDNGVAWAEDVASKHWPKTHDSQLDLITRLHGSSNGDWLAKRLLEMVPKVPVRELLPVIRTIRRDRLQVGSLDPTIEAAVARLLMGGWQDGQRVNVRQTGLSLGPVVRLGEKVDRRLLDISSSNWHATWLAYKHAAVFMESPSEQVLADTLLKLVEVLDEDDYDTDRYDWLGLPWPVAACIRSSTSRDDLVELAERAARGSLGRADDWFASETRWFTEGIGQHDVLSMSEDRLPFDTGMREAGFPVALARIMAVLRLKSPRPALEEYAKRMAPLVRRCRILQVGSTRSWLASLIGWLLVDISIQSREYDTFVLPDVGLDDLKWIYQQVPLPLPVPLDILVQLSAEAPTELIELLSVTSEHSLFLGLGRRGLSRPIVPALLNAYDTAPNEVAVVRALARVAERGYLADYSLSVHDQRAHSDRDMDLSTLLIMLGQETWRTDPTDGLIALAKRVFGQSGSGFNRAVNTLRRNQATGDYLNKFVVILDELRPLDGYRASEHYYSLLEDVMDRQTSRFRDQEAGPRFALPEGVIELLERGR